MDSVVTVAAREGAAIAVEPVLVSWGFGDLIAEAGEPISSAQFAAITELGLHEQSTARVFGWPVVITGLVAVGLALTWYRVAGDQSQPRHLVLLAAFFVLSAFLVRAINSIPN